MSAAARFALALGAMTVAVGCATPGSPKSTLDEIKEAVEGYNHAFRWKNYERASGYLPNDLRAAFVAAYEDDESSLQVEDYTILRVDVVGDKAADVAVKVRYMLLPSTTVQHTTLAQHWRKLEGSWILETEEDSIRKIDPLKIGKKSEALEKSAATPDSEKDTPWAH